MATLPELSWMAFAARYYPEEFAARDRYWLHGSIQAGLDFVAREMINTETNIGKEIEDVLLELKRDYTEAQTLQQNRRKLNRSDGPPDTETKLLEALAQKISMIELHYQSLKRQLLFALQKTGLQKDLAERLGELAVLNGYAKYLDYMAILYHEIQVEPLLAPFQFRLSTYKSCVQIVKQMAEEEENHKANNTSRPIFDSIVNAHPLVAHIFHTPFDMVLCLQSYAKRNTAFHTGVKTMADEAEWGQLHTEMVKDYKNLDFKNYTNEDKEKYRMLLHAIAGRFYDVFDWEDDYWIPNKYARDRRDNRAQKGQKTDPTSFSPVDVNALLAKQERARNASNLDTMRIERAQRYKDLSSSIDDAIPDKDIVQCLQETSTKLYKEHVDSFVEMVRQKMVAEKAVERSRELKEKVKDLEQNVDDLKQEVVDLKQEVDGLKPQIVDYKKLVVELQGQIEELQNSRPLKKDDDHNEEGGSGGKGTLRREINNLRNKASSLSLRKFAARN